MKSLETLEELNRTLIDANKRCDVLYEEVGEYDKEKGDYEHDILNKYKNSYKTLSAKDKRIMLDEFFIILADRHNTKYDHRETEILKELYNTPRIRKSF